MGNMGNIQILTFEQAIELGFSEFTDDRHFCTECSYYNKNSWKGKCHQGVTQFPKTLNRCPMFKEVLKPKDVFTDNRFWE